MRPLFCIVAVVVVASVVTPVATAQTAGLEIVEPDKVAFTTSDGKAKATSVWVENSTSAGVTPQFELVLEDGDGKEITGLTVTPDPAGAVEPGAVGRFRLTIEGTDSSTKGSGQLVARGGSGAPGTVAASVGPEPKFLAGADDPLWIPLPFVFLVFVFGLAKGGVTHAWKKIPAAKFSFGDSFATSLTAVGAVLGTVLGAGVLPEQTTTLSKEAFTALNVLFGVAVAIAAVVPAITQDDGGTDTRVGLFWLAAVITVWAVLGELITLWMLVGELGAEQGFSGTAVDVFHGLLIVGGVAVLISSALRLARVTRQSAAPTPAGVFALPTAVAPRTPLL